MPLQLAVVGGGSNAQSLVLGMSGMSGVSGVGHQRKEKSIADDNLPVVQAPGRPRSAKEREDITKELVRIEKRHWDKGSSWGDQLPTLVAKRDAYVFVLLDDATRQGDAGEYGAHPIAYAVVYINALHAQLSKVFTMPALRGQGLATRLVGIVLEAVWQLKKGPGYEVTLMVEVGNLAAQAVYERCGFRRDGNEVLDYYAVGRHAFRMKILRTSSSVR